MAKRRRIFLGRCSGGGGEELGRKKFRVRRIPALSARGRRTCWLKYKAGVSVGGGVVL